MLESAEIIEFFKILLGGVFILCFIVPWIPSANFHKLSGGISCLFIYVFTIFLLLVYTPTIIIPTNSNIFNILIFLFALLLVIFSLVCIPPFINALRIINYYMNKDKVFSNGYKDVGKIINIKRSYRDPNTNICYLIVDYNGEKIKSMYFFEDSLSHRPSYYSKYCKTYSLGENIDIMIYNKYKYVILN